NASGYFAVWLAGAQGTQSYQLRGGRVSSTGVVLDPDGFLMSSSDDGQQNTDPSVASNGSDYLVVWALGRVPDPDADPDANIWGMRVSGASRVDSFPVSTAISPTQQNATVGGNGTGGQVFLAWEDSRNGGWDIYG